MHGKTIIDLGQRQAGLRSIIFNRLTPTRGLAKLTQTISLRAKKNEIALEVRPDQLLLAGKPLDNSKLEAYLLHRAGVRQVAVKAGTDAATIKKGLNALTDSGLSGIERRLPKQFKLDPDRPFTETISGHYNRLTNLPGNKRTIITGWAVTIIGISPLALLPIALGIPQIALLLTGPVVHICARTIAKRRAAAAERKVAELSWDEANRKELATHLANSIIHKGPATLTETLAEETITRAFRRQTDDAAGILEATKAALAEMSGGRRGKTPHPATGRAAS